MPAELLALTLRIAPGFRVDRERKQLTNLAVMSGNRVAAGHGIYLDARTIAGAHAAVQASGGKLRATLRHSSLMDQLFKRGDRVLDMPGFFSGLSQVGDQLVAGKFEFFETFAAAQPKVVDLILEMAEKTPELFGLSAEPAGHAVWVAQDGTEHEATRDPFTGKWAGQPEGVALANEGLPTLRVTRLGVAAFVDQPAANDGLFAKFSALFSGARPDRALLRELAAAIVEFTEAAPPEAVAAPACTSAPEGKGSAATAHSPVTPALSTMEKLLLALKAKFAADPARLAAAVQLALADSALATVEQVEARLAAADSAAQLSAVTGERDTLKSENAELKTKLAAAEKRATDAEAKFAAVRDSGHGAPVNLGTATGTGGTAATTELTGLARTTAAFASLPINAKPGRN